jgi:hypothetical protein
MTDGVSFDSNQYVLFLPFSKLGVFINTYGTTIKMRSSVSDVTGKVLYDEYLLTFKYACWTDQLTSPISSNILDQVYEFGAGPVSLTLPSVT